MNQFEDGYQRRLNLEGASNFRDFGGYPTPDGRVLRGRLFRSDRLSKLTPADVSFLDTLNLRWIVDLRRSSESDKDRTVWLGEGGPELWHLPLFEDSMDRSNALQLIAADPNKRNDPEAAAAIMADMYRDLLNKPETRQQYRKLFLRLAEEAAPSFVVHCSAGKDRTGIVAALVQLLLGVSEADVMADFMLTQQFYDGEALMRERSSQVLEHEGVEIGEAALLPVFTVQERYMEAALDEINNRYAGIDNYLTRELDLSSSVLAEIRAALIERN